MFPLYLLILCLLHAHLIGGQYSGEECVYKKTNQSGICIDLRLCDHAQELLKSKTGIPQHCEEFKGLFPVVCCPERKSVIYCLKRYTPVFGFTGISRGEKASPKEFPHMAAIGYGEQSDIKWYCGGSLINEQYVLTAAHCINDKTYGRARWVRLGDLDLYNDTDDAQPQNFTISQVHRHPEYKPLSHYHDIALIKLDRKADFTDFVKPACLNTLNPVNKVFTITGWGTISFGGATSSHLLKAEVDYIDHETCSRSYASVPKRKLKNGIVDDLLICAGRQEGQDTCPGDSGGPLQYKVPVPPHHQIVGVTSFGKSCGLDNSVAVYTRVSNYLSWIESIVWPL